MDLITRGIDLAQGKTLVVDHGTGGARARSCWEHPLNMKNCSTPSIHGYRAGYIITTSSTRPTSARASAFETVALFHAVPSIEMTMQTERRAARRVPSNNERTLFIIPPTSYSLNEFHNQYCRDSQNPTRTHRQDLGPRRRFRPPQPVPPILRSCIKIMASVVPAIPLSLSQIHSG